MPTWPWDWGFMEVVGSSNVLFHFNECQVCYVHDQETRLMNKVRWRIRDEKEIPIAHLSTQQVYPEARTEWTHGRELEHFSSPYLEMPNRWCSAIQCSVLTTSRDRVLFSLETNNFWWLQPTLRGHCEEKCVTIAAKYQEVWEILYIIWF